MIGVEKRTREHLLEHCLGLVWDRREPPARDRLDALLGRELARRLVLALAR